MDFTFQTGFAKYPCFRFYNSQSGDYFYTTSEVERDNLIQNSPSYHYEGIAFYAYKSLEMPGIKAVNRYRNCFNSLHVYCMPPESPGYNWDPEGMEFSAFNCQMTDTVPVYRFFDTQRGGHLYTTSTIERDWVLVNLPHYQYEGIVFYVYPTSTPSCPAKPGPGTRTLRSSSSGWQWPPAACP